MAGPRHDGLGQRIAAAAARLAAETGDPDLTEARRKAAVRLGVRDPRLWPDLATVAALLRQEQKLFWDERQTNALAQLRDLAAQAMRDLAAFAPRLVGPVLDGTADIHSPIRLLLRADTPEDVIFALTDRHIPWHDGEVRLHYSRGRQQSRPRLRFRAGDTAVELVILGPADRNDPPVDPDTGRPLRGADLTALLALRESQVR